MTANKKLLQINYEEYATSAELSEKDRELLERARAVTVNSYSPYSKFQVAAAARLADGKIYTGTNQENASYAVTMCAEQALFMQLSTTLGSFEVDTLAVSFNNLQGESNFPISPCGKCRQFLAEYEQNRLSKPIRVLMSGMSGKVWIVNSVADLLPFSFSAASMNIEI